MYKHVLECGVLPWPRVVSGVGNSHACEPRGLSQAHCVVIRPGSFVPFFTSLTTITTALARTAIRNTLETTKILELGTWGKRRAWGSSFTFLLGGTGD